MLHRLTYLLKLITITLLGFSAAYAQPFCSVDIYNIHDGMPSNFVSEITQTPDGLIWLSTWNGLCHYDGYTFSSFPASQERGELSSNRLLAIDADSKGNLLTITYDRHLYHFDTRALKYTELVPRKPDGSPVPFSPRSLHTPKAGVTWVTSDFGGCAIRLPDTQPLDTAKIEYFDASRLGGATLLRIIADSKGREWIVTDKGVGIYGQKFRAKGRFTDIIECDGKIWLSTADGRLLRYNEKTRTLTPVDLAAIPHSSIRCLSEGESGELLAGSDRGVISLNTATGVATLLTAPPGAADISDIFRDSKGRLWVFSQADGITLYSGADRQPLQLQCPPAYKANTHSSLNLWHEDSYGTVWLVPRNGVFGYYDTTDGSLHPYAIESRRAFGRSLPAIEKVFSDRQKNLWACSTRDLALISFHHNNLCRSVLDNNQETRSVLPLPDGGWLAGTAAGQLCEFDADGNLHSYLGHTPAIAGRSRLTHSPAPTRFAQKLYALYRDSKGNTWVGSKGEGLFRITPAGDITNYRTSAAPGSLSCDTVYSIDEDERGNIWIGTHGAGLNKAVTDASGEVTFINHRHGMPTYPVAQFPNIRRITHDGKGTVILSTATGLVTFNNSAPMRDCRFFTTRTRPNDTTSLHNNNVMQTLAARNGNIYVISLGGGLQRVTSKSLLTDNLSFTGCNTGVLPSGIRSTGDNQGNNFAMAEDDKGNFILVREGDLLVYTGDSKQWMALGINDFGAHNEFTETLPAYNAHNGKLLLGVIGGVLAVNPDEIRKRDYAPPIVFTAVQYQGESDKTPILNTDRIEVPADKRNMTITFAALDYAAREGVQYAYMLEGVDADWTYLGYNNTAQLNRLSAGNYTLLVKASNGDGIWSDDIARLDIRCLPGFWETPWAKLIYVLITLGLAALAMHTLLLRKKNAMRRDLDRMKNSFYTDASHRLRTPLTLIGGPAAEILKDPNLSEESRANVEMLIRNSNSMLEVVNNMLRYARDNQDSVYISDQSVPEFDTLSRLTDEDSEAYREFFAPASASAEAEADPQTVILIVEDNDDLRRYLANILSSSYTVLTAPNGAVGLEMAQRKQPDFILTDVTMPEMDGLTMVHHIKQHKELSHIPIVVLSAKASMTDRLHGLKEGIDDYITKPFSASYLKHRIANIVSRRRLLQQSYLDRLGHGVAGSTQPAAAATASTAAETPAAQLPPPPELPEATVETAAATPEEPKSNEETKSTTHSRREYQLDSPQITDADQEMMERLLKFIEQRIDDESLKIEELAEAVNLGRTVFYGKIKSLVGMSPSDFLRHLRLKRAEELITKSKMNLSQIAFNVGFSDPKYFTKCFKKEMGMTPSQYRQNARKTGGETE